MRSQPSKSEAPEDILGQYTACLDKLERMERAALNVYRPSAKQEEFHLSRAQQKIIRGGRQSGKSIAASAEFASRVTGIPIIGRDGKPLKTNWRIPSKNNPFTAWVVGWDEDHIGQTIHRLLFQEGARNAVRVIRDEHTGEYRIWSFADPADKAMEDQSVLAGPMIPEDMIDHWAWDSSAQKVFEACYLTNGTVIYAFPSSARHPKQGEAVDLIWIDEDIQHPDHYIEWRYRLGLRAGTILWSVWPHQENTALMDLLDAAEEQHGSENPSVEAFQLISSENEWIPLDQRQSMLSELRDDEQIRRHDRGEIVQNRLYMYDFAREIHLLKKRAPSDLPTVPKTPREVLETSYSIGGRFPRQWTRYLAIDPSHQRTAVLSLVVTPDVFMDVEIGHRVIVEWDLIAKRAKASDLCKQLKPLLEGYDYEAFVMDQNKGRQTNTGEGRTTYQVYEDAFEEAGFKSRQTKHGFFKGCNIPTKRQNTVREWLAASWGGLPQLLFCDQHTAACQWEIYRYFKKQMSDGTILDEAANPRKFDAMACHDEQTDVLTDDGWKRFADVDEGDLLATVNLKTDKIEYQFPTSVHSYEYCGEMIHFGGYKMNALVTPNHRMVSCSIQSWRNKDRDFRFVDAGGISKWEYLKLTSQWDGIKRDEPFLVPYVAGQSGLEKEVAPGLWAEFLGWYIAEGCCDNTIKCPGNGYRVTVSQKTERKKTLLRMLLQQMPWKWTETKDGFSCSSKQLWTFLHPMGDVYTKRVPEWVRFSEPEIIRRFLIGAVLGDGNVQFDKRNYYTSSRRLADDIQELFLKLNVSASIHCRLPKEGGTIRGRPIKGTVPNWRVLERIQHIATLFDHSGKPNYGPVKYEGRVYCASVPNGTLITRRGDRPLISGNSLEYGVEFLRTPIETGTAYRVYKPDLAQTPEWARKVLEDTDPNKRRGQQIHLGPGLAAA